MKEVVEVLESSNELLVCGVLTIRELEYLSLAALGNKNIEIAKILSVTQSTVKKTFESVFLKLRAKDRTHAVTIAFLHQILNSKVLNYIRMKYNIVE